MSDLIKILSLGAGVQSTTLLLMSIKGILPKLDYCIFADTGYEPPPVYKHLEWLKKYSEDNGIPVFITQKGQIHDDYFNKKRFVSIPFFVKNPSGSKGILPRHCTGEYKIEPLEQFIKREILKLPPKGRVGNKLIIDQWFGITLDEERRCKHPRRKKDNRPRKNRCNFMETS